MDEPVLYNSSGFHASVLPILDREGAQSRIVIVKASYAIGAGGALVVAEEQREVRLGDEPWGSPEIPDIRLPGGLLRRRTIFASVDAGASAGAAGHADRRRRHPRGRTHESHSRAWPARVATFAAWRRAWAQCADAVRRRSLGCLSAYGGRHRILVLRHAILWAVALPAMSSASSAHGRRRLRNLVLPSERQEDALRRPDAHRLGQASRPVETMGTYDKAWLESIYPALDYREEHENCAPPDFVFREPLRGGEPITVTGVHSASPLTFILPKHRILIESGDRWSCGRSAGLISIPWSFGTAMPSFWNSSGGRSSAVL